MGPASLTSLPLTMALVLAILSGVGAIRERDMVMRTDRHLKMKVHSPPPLQIGGPDALAILWADAANKEDERVVARSTGDSERGDVVGASTQKVDGYELVSVGNPVGVDPLVTLM